MIAGTTRFENRERTHHTTGPGVSVAGGVSFLVGKRWRIGPEGRLLMLNGPADDAPWLAIYGGVRVALPLGGR